MAKILPDSIVLAKWHAKKEDENEKEAITRLKKGELKNINESKKETVTIHNDGQDHKQEELSSSESERDTTSRDSDQSNGIEPHCSSKDIHKQVPTQLDNCTSTKQSRGAIPSKIGQTTL